MIGSVGVRGNAIGLQAVAAIRLIAAAVEHQKMRSDNEAGAHNAPSPLVGPLVGEGMYNSAANSFR